MEIMLLKEMDTLEDIRSIIASHPAVMLYFYNDQCQPCMSLRPKVEALLKEEFEKFRLVYINGFEHPQVSASFMVFSHPTLIIFLDGNEYIRESQYVSIAQLERAIRRPYELLFAS